MTNVVIRGWWGQSHPSDLSSCTKIFSELDVSNLSGWVWKRKSEGKLSRFLSQFNKRHLTIDFKKEVFLLRAAPLEESRDYPFNELLSAYAISSPEANRSVLGKFSKLKADDNASTPNAEHGICVQT